MALTSIANDELGLRGKTVWVTGGSRGIGRSICLRLGEAGARVVVGYRQNQQAADAVVAHIKASGGDGWSFPFVLETPQGLAAQVLARWPEVDVLVHNAAHTEPGALVGMERGSVLERSWAVNVLAPLVLTRDCLPALRRSEAPSVIFISSYLASVGAAGVAAYAASKSGLEGLALALARELGPQIRSNVVVPGFVETDLTADYTERIRKVIVSSTPLLRTGQPDEVAQAVLWLASRASGQLTGQVLHVGGGIGIHPE